MSKETPRSHYVGTAQRGAPIFYRARADRIHLTALSPREFRRATEAGAVPIDYIHILSKIRIFSIRTIMTSFLRVEIILLTLFLPSCVRFLTIKV